MGDLVALKDVQSGATEWLDARSGEVFADEGGLRRLRTMEPTEYILGEKGEPLRDGLGRMIHCSALSNAAHEHYQRKVARATGRNVRLTGLRDPDRAGALLRDESGRLVTMDLAPSDVHTNAALANYAAGYHLESGVADVASPVVMVPKQSDVFYTWDNADDFKRKIPNAASPGGAVAEVNPTLTPATYTTVEYALGGFLPTEVQSNADAPLQPFVKMTQIVVDGLTLEREIRVATLLQASANWNSGLVTTLLSGAQWDGGGSSDPLANLQKTLENSYMPVTGIVWSEQVEHDFVRNPAVQKYFTYKDSVTGVPDPRTISTQLRLPPIYTGRMKYITGGALTYVWGSHVVLLHQPSETPPTSQMEVATSYTFRWNGGQAPDGTMTGGLLVRTYFDPKRGARGGTQVVVVVNDSEQMTSGFVGGLILNAHQ